MERLQHHKTDRYRNINRIRELAVAHTIVDIGSAGNDNQLGAADKAFAVAGVRDLLPHVDIGDGDESPCLAVLSRRRPPTGLQNTQHLRFRDRSLCVITAARKVTNLCQQLRSIYSAIHLKPKAIFLFILFIIAHFSAYAQNPDRITPLTDTRPTDGLPAAVRAHLAAFVATSPREEGSEGEQQASEYIIRFAERLGLAYRMESLEELVDQHSFAHNLVVELPGLRRDSFIIAVPLNDRYREGSDASQRYTDDRSLALAVGLALMERYATVTPPVSLLFLFLGAEEGELESYPLGSRLFLQTFEPQVPTAGIYLDLRSVSSDIDTYIGGGARVSPAWLVRALANSTRSLDLRIRLDSFRIQAIRTRIAIEQSPVSPFIEAGIPFIGLKSERERGRAAAGDSSRANPILDDYITLLTTMIDRLDRGIPQEWDRHYLVFPTPFGLSIIGELVFVVLLLIVFGSLLFYAFFSPLRTSRYWRLLLRNLWSAIALLLVLFSALELGTIVLLLISRVHQTLDVWRYTPFLSVAIKFSLTTVIITYLFPIMRRLPFTWNPSFYSAAALLSGLINVLIGLLFNITFCYFFAWMFVCIFAFTLIGKRWLRLVLLCLGLLPLIAGLYQILSLPLYPAIEFLVVEPLLGNILLAFWLFPPLLLLARLYLHGLQHGFAKWRMQHRIVTVIGPLIVGIQLIIALLRPPFSEQLPQPISVTEIIDSVEQSHLLRFDSPKVLQDIVFLFGDERYTIDSRRRSHTIRLPDIAAPVSIGRTDEDFLSRRRHTLTIQPNTAVRRIDLELRDQAEIFFFDGSHPVSLHEENRRAQIHIGLGPTFPLTVDYTLPEEQEPQLSLRASGDRLTRPLVSERPDIQFTTRLEIRMLERPDGSN